jgi:hypothetical protein
LGCRVAVRGSRIGLPCHITRVINNLALNRMYSLSRTSTSDRDVLLRRMRSSKKSSPSRHSSFTQAIHHKDTTVLAETHESTKSCEIESRFHIRRTMGAEQEGALARGVITVSCLTARQRDPPGNATLPKSFSEHQHRWTNKRAEVCKNKHTGKEPETSCECRHQGAVEPDPPSSTVTSRENNERTR